MSLPVLTLPIHIIELPISKQKIEIKPYIIKEEKALLTSINTENKEDLIKIFRRLIENCLITKTLIIDDLNIVDFFYLILQIRMKSTGEIIDGSLKCKECKKETEFTINLEEAIKVIDSDISIININKDLTLQIEPPKIESLISETEADIINIVASAIKKVIYQEKVYTDFTEEEVKTNILSNLTKGEFNKLYYEGIDKLAKLLIEFEFTCIHCGHVNKYSTEDISDFF